MPAWTVLANLSHSHTPCTSCGLDLHISLYSMCCLHLYTRALKKHLQGAVSGAAGKGILSGRAKRERRDDRLVALERLLVLPALPDIAGAPSARVKAHASSCFE